MDEKFLEQLNDFYRTLEYRRLQVCAALNHRAFSLTSYYSVKHSCFDANGQRVSEDYPLPYIEAEGICYFQIDHECLSCFTKIRRLDAPVLNNDVFRPFDFDIWGDDDYYTLLYRTKQSGKSLSETLALSKERCLVVHFRLPSDMGDDAVYRFAKILRKSGFFI